ncbi:hypothetical protein BH09BAC5_BH09BAC5_28340 [soil metagenome]
MKLTKTVFTGGILFLLLSSFVLDGDDTSNIEKKEYKITITESKKGKSGKPDEDVIAIKGSKFRSKFFKQNAGADAIPVELSKDSTYTEEGNDEEMLYVEFEGEMTNKLEETVKVSGTIDGYGIEGSVEISKKEKVKKHWDFVGTQKDRKSKK